MWPAVVLDPSLAGHGAWMSCIFSQPQPNTVMRSGGLVPGQEQQLERGQARTPRPSAAPWHVQGNGSARDALT